MVLPSKGEGSQSKCEGVGEVEGWGVVGGGEEVRIRVRVRALPSTFSYVGTTEIRTPH